MRVLLLRLVQVALLMVLLALHACTDGLRRASAYAVVYVYDRQ